MGRLINSDDVEKLLISRYEGEEYIRADVRKIPTAYGLTTVECKNCGEIIDKPEGADYKYCLYCGQKL